MFRGELHNKGADGLCEACGESFPCPTGIAIYDSVVPRQLPANPRCSACKTGTMFHPAHRFGPCQVTRDGGEVCGCSDVETPQPTETVARA